MAMIMEGDADTFNALAFGEQHPNALQWLQQQAQQVSPLLNSAGQAFMQQARNLYEQVSGSAAIRIARAARRRVSQLFQTSMIRCLQTIGEMQHASSTMQRWIMADPVVRKMYYNQQLDGYSDSYLDVHVGDIGADHYDYRRVMNGIVVDNEDGSWSATTYMDELFEDDRELDLMEQVDILDTWGNIRALIRQRKDDPTSRWNAELG